MTSNNPEKLQAYVKTMQLAIADTKRKGDSYDLAAEYHNWNPLLRELYSGEFPPFVDSVARIEIRDYEEAKEFFENIAWVVFNNQRIVFNLEAPQHETGYEDVDLETIEEFLLWIVEFFGFEDHSGRDEEEEDDYYYDEEVNEPNDDAASYE